MKEIKRRLKIFLMLFFLVAFSGTIGFMFLENLSFAEAFYYNIVTMSTVGYGDIHPTGLESRIFAIFLIVLGGSTFLGVIANATELLIFKRDAQTRKKKVNMVLGTFFSETGYHLLDLFASLDKNIETIRKDLLLGMDWDLKKFSTASQALNRHTYELDVQPVHLSDFNDLLAGKRKFLINLIENPALTENERFSDLLLSLFHLMDELNSRDRFSNLPETDIHHLSGDIQRAYRHLLIQWIEYLKHLKIHYPYLYSLAVRKNPFNLQSDAVIR